jgi:hypothetical protein
MRNLSVVVSVSLAMCLAACGKSPEERAAGAALSAMTGADVAVEKDGDKVTFGVGDGAMTISSGDSARLPDDFPKQIFLPADYSVDSVVDSAGFTMVALRTPGKVGDVAARASEHMLGHGWKQNMMAGDDSSRILSFQNSKTVALLSFDSHDDGGVLYSVQLSPVSN